MTKEMDQTAVSATKVSPVTFKIWQNGTKEKVCNFATFHKIVDKRTSIIQTDHDYILKRKSCFSANFFSRTRKFLSVILRLTSLVLCLTYNMKIRTLQLMVTMKTSKLQGYPFFKSHRGTIPYIVCENEIPNQCLFSKATRTTNAKHGNGMPWSTFITCV